MKYFKLITAALLVWALADNPYGYYTFLRWMSTAAMAITAYLLFDEKQKVSLWVVLFGMGTILMNPIIPVHLDRDTWKIIDLALAGLLGVSAFVHSHKNA